MPKLETFERLALSISAAVKVVLEFERTIISTLKGFIMTKDVQRVANRTKHV